MKVTAREIQEMAADRMSMGSRLRYVALLLVAAAGAVVAGSLWLTEPALPARTQVAFALLLAINLSWVGFATWVLTRRRVLLARHAVVSARMAVGFSALFAVGAWAIGHWSGGPSMYAASACGLVMLAVAIALLVRADRRFAQLVERRREIERALDGGRTAGA